MNTARHSALMASIPLKTLKPRHDVMKKTTLLIPMILGMSLAGCTIIPNSEPLASTEAAAAPKTSPKPEATREPAKPLAKTADADKEQTALTQAAPTKSKPLSSPPTEQPAVRPGECWVQAVIHPKPVRKPVDIVVRDAVNDIDVTPAEIEP
ncbi:MAG: hypothetical protein FNT29_10470, partial [Halothiobacillaceae bacterium]